MGNGAAVNEETRTRLRPRLFVRGEANVLVNAAGAADVGRSTHGVRANLPVR
jgi:hypothetical protein